MMIGLIILTVVIGITVAIGAIGVTVVIDLGRQAIKPLGTNYELTLNLIIL
ncbi:hypothetical protein [Clostridium tagluense]|nr:hypothetical protein [Clostridium tagluense]